MIKNGSMHLTKINSISVSVVYIQTTKGNGDSLWESQRQDGTPSGAGARWF